MGMTWAYPPPAAPPTKTDAGNHGDFTDVGGRLGTPSTPTNAIPMLQTFHPEGGSLRWLPETGEGVDLQVGRQRLHQADGHRALALTQRGGGDAVTNTHKCFNHSTHHFPKRTDAAAIQNEEMSLS